MEAVESLDGRGCGFCGRGPKSFSASRTNAASMSVSTPSRSHPMRSAMVGLRVLRFGIGAETVEFLQVKLHTRFGSCGQGASQIGRVRCHGPFERSLPIRLDRIDRHPATLVTDSAAIRPLVGDFLAPAFPPGSCPRATDGLRITFGTVGHPRNSLKRGCYHAIPSALTSFARE